ncbi:MAG: HdaA/DnaA family protein, partial [Thiobacillaceae bacterium]
EALAMLQSICEGRDHEPVYLWGPAGCGKSLMLHALAECLPNARLLQGENPDWPQASQPLLIDDADRLTEENQIRAFDHYNRNRADQQVWVASGLQAPSGLTSLRDDLRTRLGWGLVYQIYPLNDAEKREALLKRAEQLGFALDGAIADYLLTRYSRELRQLLAIVEALDRFSLEQHRQVSLGLLKSLLPTRS